MRLAGGEEQSPLRDLLLLAAGFGLLFFQFLGRLPLIDPDEGRYAEVAREMLERGDFITPTLNYVKYFEKPPLHYWLNALSLSILGESEFAARFAGTLCGLLTVLLVYWLGRTLFGRRPALLAATVLGTATGFLVQARINFTDMTLTFCLTAALGFFIMAARDEARHKIRDYHLFYLFMALAVLAKGLIGIVLPGAVIFTYLAFTRRWYILREMRLFSGILLFLIVCAPWFILVSQSNPEFPHFFFVQEHLQRFFTRIHHRYQPVWFFIPVLLATMLPWSLFIPAAVRKAWRDRRGNSATLFMLIWAGLIFTFFSLSSSKLIPYILPVFPPLALLIGKWFAESGESRFLKLHGIITAGFFAVVGVAAMLYPHLMQRPHITPPDGLLLGGLFLIQGGAVLFASRRPKPLRIFTSLAATACLVGICGPAIVYRRVMPDKSAKELAGVVSAKTAKDAKLVCCGRYQAGLSFYTHRRVMVVGGRDELEFGSMQGDNNAWFMEKEEFPRVWDSGEVVSVVIRERDLPVLTRMTRKPFRTVGTAGDRLLICNDQVEEPPHSFDPPAP